MRSGREQEIDHLYRRAGFGASQEEVEAYTSLSFASYAASVARLLNYADIPDDVDSLIGRPGYVGVTGRSGSGFQPANNILDARQRWLFRMVHTKRPLQEKMALFWHNHFATAYSKIAGEIGDGERRDADARGQARPRMPAGRRDRSSCFASTRSATSATC